MKFKTIYNYKQKDGVKFKTPSLTQQQFKDECDINKIMDRYLRTGVLSDPLNMRGPGTYGDFTEMGDYQENMNKIIAAREMFDSLPSKVRNRFGNNPAEMINFVLDSSNKNEAIKLGLLKEEIIKEINVTSPEVSSPTKEESKQSLT